MKNLAEEKIDLIIKIFESDITDEEKAIKFNEVISYRDLDDIIHYRNINRLNINHKLKKVIEIYDQFKKHGLFDKYKYSYRCDMEELKKRLDNLNTIYSALKSNLSNEEKLQIILNIYNDINEIKTKYNLILKYGSHDPRLDYARKALDDFDFILSTLSSFSNIEIKNAKYRNEIEKTLEENNYLDNYLYAEYVINTYISDQKSYLKNKFMKKMEINNEILEYCEELIKFVNPALYKKYVETVSENNKKRTVAINQTIRDLATGINTGYLQDGTEFNILEFYKRVPFKESGLKFVSTLKDYIYRNIEVDSGVYRIINNYLYQNHITKIIFIDEEELIKTKISYRGVEINSKIIHNVFRYIEVNDLPKIMNVYEIVLKKYMNNEININLLDLERKKTSICNNQYKLVQKNK